MATQEQTSTFFSDAANFLYALDIKDGQFQFVRTGRDTLADLPFLDTRTLGTAKNKAILGAAEVIKGLDAIGFREQFQKSSYLFHTSFCCSTMIARCLDAPGVNLALKEPYALLGLSSFKRLASRFEATSPDWKNLSNMTLFLLSRRFKPNEKILIKPSNGANNILPEILNFPHTGKVLLLYSNLEHFLVSVISGGTGRADYVKGILKVFMKDFAGGLDLKAPKALNSMQRAALVWGLQMRAFEVAAGGSGALRTLDCDRFLEDPREALADLSKFYGLGFSSVNLDDICRGPALSMHAKEPGKAFSPGDREQEKKVILAERGGEIESTMRWCRDLGFDFKAGLSNPL